MTTKIFLLFPIHLFNNIELLQTKKVYLIEEPRYFTDFSYHKLKLAFHRATMKCYYDYLQENDIDVEYIEYSTNVSALYKRLHKTKTSSIEMYSPCDSVLERKITKHIPNITIHNTIQFLVTPELLQKNKHQFHNGHKYNHSNFYKWQRTRLNILIDETNKPVGGKWSYDDENRKKLPKSIELPAIPHSLDNAYIREAKKYVERHFPSNYGNLDHFVYPISHIDALKWLHNFLQHYLSQFGPYEDAVSTEHPFLFHSVLSPMMNVGLLTDEEVITVALTYQSKAPLNSFEGFIRQIIGWRNYMYSIYVLDGEKLKTMNFLNHTNRMNKKMLWEGTTDILPIDDIIHKIKKYAYAHHIERLMFLGNYMLLCMYHPTDVYEIFMEWTIDAYEWVMVPNVYCMSQFADGGVIMMRPYISSSNYLRKMSHYSKGDWCNIFDALYYHFIYQHREYLKKNYSTSRQVLLWDKKTDVEQKRLLDVAKSYLSQKG